MCLKQEGGQGVCRPLYGNACDSGMDVCHTASVPEGGNEGCQDSKGKWARRKCDKKLAKGKCGKKKVRRHLKKLFIMQLIENLRGMIL